MAEHIDIPGVNLATSSGEQEQKPYFFARPSSPDTNCPICLEEPQNKSYTDTCGHQFCFHCLKEWAKVKPECPLCKQNFRTIIYNIRSSADYDEHRIEIQPPPAAAVSFENTLLINLAFERHGFRYSRTTMGGTGAAMLYIENVADMYRQAHPSHPAIPPSSHMSVNNISTMWRRAFGTTEFRRQVYRQGFWSRIDNLRTRESSPEFYRNNPAQTHRLVPWLNRELNVLLHVSHDPHHICQEILSLIEIYPINSRRFADAVRPYFGSRTSHFCHEFYSFATSPYDMLTYDANTHLLTYDSLHSNEIIPQPSESSSSSDSDVEVIQVTRGTLTQPIPRSFLQNLHLQPRRLEAPLPQGPGAAVPLIEISSDSSDDEERRDVETTLNVEDDSDSSEVQIVATFPANRTPEVITLDSDDDYVSVTVSTTREGEEEGPVGSNPLLSDSEPVASTSRRISRSEAYHKEDSSASDLEAHERRWKKSKPKRKSSRKKSSKRKRSPESSPNRRSHRKKIKKEYTISPIKEEYEVEPVPGVKLEGEERRPRLRSIVRVVSPGRSVQFEGPTRSTSFSLSSEGESESESEEEVKWWRKRRQRRRSLSSTDSSSDA